MNNLKTEAGRKRQEEKIDQQEKESFPASDPPSYSGGKHIVGAPKERETLPMSSNSQAVKAAAKKVKDGIAKKPGAY